MIIKNSSAVNYFLLSSTFIIVGSYAFAALYHPKFYVLGTYEDMYGEWAQTYGFFAACLFSLLNTLNKQHTQRWFFVLLTIASFYVFMEEISWGQRLFGFTTPQFFHIHSYQDEVNIHNLLTGPVQVWTKTVLTYAVAAALSIYGVVLPCATYFQWNDRILMLLSNNRLLETPPLALAPGFLIASILELELFAFNEAEIAELLVAWLLAFIALRAWLRTQTSFNESPIPYFITSSLIIVAAWSTTNFLITSPKQYAHIQHRLMNGYEKFADRYHGYHYLSGEVEMLKQFNNLAPGNTVILRRIAELESDIGDHDQAKAYFRLAIDESKRRLKEDPLNVAMYVSLAKSYRKLTEYHAMIFYAQQGYLLALAKYQENPQMAENAYWLAKACEQVNRQSEALQYFATASELEPSEWRYDDAYNQKKIILSALEK